MFFWLFLPITTSMFCTFLHKCLFLSQFHLKNGQFWRNGPFSHLTRGSWCTQGKRSTHYKWRTRFEWRTRNPAFNPTTHPRFASARPVVPPKGATTVPKFFVLGLFELRSVHGSTIWEKCVVDRPHTSPQPTRGDGQLKKLYNIVGLQDGNVTCGHNWMVPDGSHAQI